MGTAALRDLHAAYPGEYWTGVQSPCPDLWEYNPHVRCVNGPIIEMHYPLVQGCNAHRYHFVTAYRQFLADQLGIFIPQGQLHGDLHMSEGERQIAPILDDPYWVINAGGKNDFTCKLWPHDRWQQVVDHFAGRLKFVQVGELGPNHIHAPLNGVINLLGQTNLRDLIRLVHHSAGVCCGVTMLMHMSAGLPMKDGSVRPCVVVAGGREPPAWESYNGHSYMSNVGQLPCNERLGVPGGCWRSRVEPLGDGTYHDDPDRICSMVVQNLGVKLPLCMDLISTEKVIDEIERRLAQGC